jgi:tellurite resistance protein TerC
VETRSKPSRRWSALPIKYASWVKALRPREALGWTALWVTCSLIFTAFIYFAYQEKWLGIGTGIDAIDGLRNDGHAAAVKYLTGYVIEYSLSVDNIFVMAMIFGAFRVPAIHQHRVLFWGILGALVMRGTMILAGTQLIQRYHWVIWIFGAFLIVTGIRMLFLDQDDTDVRDNAVLRFAQRHFPVASEFHGPHFAIVRDGRRMLTPLALTLILVETTDLIFAVDSVPAIFAITADPFLVFTSNIFALLGLRSLYFALAGLMDRFRYLKYALAVILLLVGVKMLAAEWLRDALGEHFNLYVLAVVLGILAIGVFASLWGYEHEEHMKHHRARGNAPLAPSSDA